MQWLHVLQFNTDNSFQYYLIAESEVVSSIAI